MRRCSWFLLSASISLFFVIFIKLIKLTKIKITDLINRIKFQTNKSFFPNHVENIGFFKPGFDVFFKMTPLILLTFLVPLRSGIVALLFLKCVDNWFVKHFLLFLFQNYRLFPCSHIWVNQTVFVKSVIWKSALKWVLWLMKDICFVFPWVLNIGKFLLNLALSKPIN